METKQKKKLTIFSILGLTSLSLIVSAAFVGKTGIIKPMNATDCDHKSVEYYNGFSDAGTGSGYVEHWACCQCHTAWADESRYIVLGNTIEDRSKLNTEVGFSFDWGAYMFTPTYDSTNERALYSSSKFHIAEDHEHDPYAFIETKSKRSLEGYESIKFHILNDTSADTLNVQFLKGKSGADWADIGFGVIPFEKGVSKAVEFSADLWNYKIADSSSGPCFLIKNPNKDEVTGSFSIGVEFISQESKINAVIDAINELPNATDYNMPADVYRIKAVKNVEALYNNLEDNLKPYVTNYDRLASILSKCENYDVVYTMDSSKNISVIPSYVPGPYSSTKGGSATFGSDYVGNYIDVTSDAEGRAALDINNFSSGGYLTLYFYVKVSSSCDIYLSDGTSNDGWGKNWKNTWSMTGLWCNANTWRQIAIDVSTGIFASNWSLGFRTEDTGITFQISDIYGCHPSRVEIPYYFGQRTPTAETHQQFGTVYNLIPSQWSIENPGSGTMASADAGVLSSALPEGYTKMIFAIYNPNTSASKCLIAGGNPWDNGSNTTLAPQAWTIVEIVEKDFAINDTGKTYYYIDNALVSGWKITAIFAEK